MLPLVSVRVATYNHEKFIVQCLEGILMQRVNFPFEIVIGEDCSTDRTREIVLDYGKKYPELIRVITSNCNVGPQQNILRINEACKGNYLALCEGDDYWIDPLKLQKQVDYMEMHSECSMCSHDAIIIFEGKDFSPRYFCSRDRKNNITIKDILSSHNPIPTASVLIRKKVLDSLPDWRENIWCGDLLVRLWCAHHGTIGYLDEIMSVYRKHPMGLSTIIRKDIDYAFSNRAYLLREFDKETGFIHTDLLTKAIRENEAIYRETKLRKRLGYFYFIFHPLKVIRKLRQLYKELWAK